MYESYFSSSSDVSYNQHEIDKLFSYWLDLFRFLPMCLNFNRSWCCIIIVFDGTRVETSHWGLDGVSSMLVFIAAILESKLGVQPKKNLNTFLWKSSFWWNLTIFLSKGAMALSKLYWLLKWSIFSRSDGSLSESELKFSFSEKYPGFPSGVHFFSSFSFPFSLIFFCASYSSSSFLSALSSNASSSPCASYYSLSFYQYFLQMHIYHPP